jgi:hypothetical protein
MSSISNRLITLLEDGEWSPSSLSVLVSTLFLGTGLLVWHNWPASVRDIREPPVLRPNIPYIGHLLGMIVHQAEYLQILACVFPILYNVPSRAHFKQKKNRQSHICTQDPLRGDLCHHFSFSRPGHL